MAGFRGIYGRDIDLLKEEAMRKSQGVNGKGTFGSADIKVSITPNFTYLLYGMRQGYRVVSLEGGSRSGKTYAALQWIVFASLEPKKFLKDFPREKLVTKCLRREAANARDSVWRDLNEILSKMGIVNGSDGFSCNKTTMCWTFPNGSEIICGGASDDGKLHGIGQDIVFFNEVMQIPKSAYDQANYRTRVAFILDWNPSLNDHWVFRQGLDKTSVYGEDELPTLRGKPKCLYAHSTYKDNVDVKTGKSNLSDYQIAAIEQYEPTEGNIERGTANKFMWDVYGLGKRGLLEGRVIPSEKVEIVPDEEFPTKRQWELHGYGLDWGFSCFSGGTLIWTRKGEKPIRDIKKGDYVLTRKGWRRVKRLFRNGVKKVENRTLHINGKLHTITATPEHRFYANKRWKRFSKLTGGDALCVLSSSTGKNISDTLTASTPTTTLKAGARSGCTTRFSGSTKEKFLRVATFITQTLTRLTMRPKTLSPSQTRNTGGYTIRSNEKATAQKNGCAPLPIPRKTGNSDELLQWNACKRSHTSASNAGRSLSEPTATRGFVAKNATTNGNIRRKKTLWRRLARFVGKLFCGTNTSNKRPAGANARTSFQRVNAVVANGEWFEEVYDIWVEGCHEYFANGILVHNCDPTALIECAIWNKKLYVRQKIYETGLLVSPDITTPDQRSVIGLLRELRIDPKETIVADSARPDLNQALRNAGYMVMDAYKPGGSIENGINLMNQRKWCVADESFDVKFELENWIWAKGRYGEQKRKPIDKHNHAMDAVRYWVSTFIDSGNLLKVSAFDDDDGRRRNEEQEYGCVIWEY